MSRRQDRIACIRRIMRELGHKPGKGYELPLNMYRCQCTKCHEPAFLKAKMAGMSWRYWYDGPAVEKKCTEESGE